MACLFSDEKCHFFASDLAAQEYPIGALCGGRGSDEPLLIKFVMDGYQQCAQSSEDGGVVRCSAPDADSCGRFQGCLRVHRLARSPKRRVSSSAYFASV